MLDFPSAPSTGQKYPAAVIAGIPQYTWDGEKWTTVGSGSATTAPPAAALPLMNATLAVVGVTTKYAREDHVHPTDTSMLQKSANLSDVTNIVTARQSIYAAPFDAMAYSGMQINGNADVIQEGSPLAIISSSSGVVRPCDGWFASCAQASGAVNMQAYRNASAISGYQWDVRLAAGNSNFTAATAGDVVYLRQAIEGYRVARLGWGTTAASPLSYAFQLYASVAGTFFIRLFNSAVNRIYYKEHTVTAGYNWVVATIPGDTSGTWLADNNVGLYLDIVFGGKETSPAVPNAWGGSPAKAQTTGSTNFMATTSNIVAITGFIILPGIEAPSAARSPLIMRPFDQELVTCKRYWQSCQLGLDGFASGAGVVASQTFQFSPPMRSIPTMAMGVQNFAPVNVGTPALIGATNLASSYSIGGTSTGAGRFYYYSAVIFDARL